MQAYAIDAHGDIADLRLRSLPTPEPERGEVQVRVRAAALNPADLKVIRGKEGGRFIHASRFPLVPGFDFSGIVEGLGEGADDWQLGDEVFGFLPYSPRNKQGSCGQYVTTAQTAVGRKPAQLSHLQAACAATTASTALQALRDQGRVQEGQRVLIHGASGGVGSAAVQIARHFGAEAWGTCSREKADFVQSLGAARVVDYHDTPLASLAATFQIVLDAASVASYRECSALLTRGGTYITLLPALRHVPDVLASLGERKRVRFLVVRSKRDDLERIAAWMADGSLRSCIDSSYAVEDLPAALQRLDSGRVQGKIGVTVT